MVWRTAQRLHAALSGATVTRCELRWPSLATADLTGHEVREAVSAGKHILIRLVRADDVPLTLHSHLRMDGSWSLHRTGSRPVPGPRSAVRAVLANSDWTAVGHRLGMLDLVPTAHEDRLIGHLGPDLLGPDWDAERAVAAIAGSGERPLGEVLLDQQVLAGVGTFYLCESLFLRGISPLTPASALHVDGIRALVDLLHRLLTRGARTGIQVTTGVDRAGRRNWVHARGGRPCLRCGTPIQKLLMGPATRERIVSYCAHCQPG